MKETQFTIVGRSSSHFTRTVRMFARELGLTPAFEVVPNLLATEAGAYAGNPALRLPILRVGDAAWFGALNICRELARHSTGERRIVWPEDLTVPVLANAQELTLQAMATEVALIMAKLAGADAERADLAKLRLSLQNSLAWLETHVQEVLSALPRERDLSYLEVTLFCLLTHLEFRDMLTLATHAALAEFCRSFAERPAAVQTSYHFDA